MDRNISIIGVEKIIPNQNNPRTRIEDTKDLEASILENGLMQPIIVRWTKKRDKNGMPTGYEVIAGSRRLTACKNLGINKVDCIVMNVDDTKAFELATTENIIRENMNAVDEANAIAKMFNEGKSKLEIKATFGKSMKWVESRLKLPALGKEAMKLLADGTINLGHAEALCYCRPDRVERWLDYAKYNTPENVKRAIMNERKNLSKAPFDVKKICKGCKDRSDVQTDIFGDVTECYCLNEECYKQKMDDECERLRKSFKKAGYSPVEECNVSAALNCIDNYYFDKDSIGYFFPNSERLRGNCKDEANARAEELRNAGMKPEYVIDEKNAVGYLVWKNVKLESDEDDESEDDSDSDETSGPFAGLNSSDKKKVNQYANEEEDQIVNRFVTEEFAKIDSGNFDNIMKMVAHAFEFRVRYEEADEEGETKDIEESPITSESESVSEEYEDETFSNSADAVIQKIVDSIVLYRGIEDESLRKFFKVPPRSELLQKARERFDEEKDSKESENDSQEEED